MAAGAQTAAGDAVYVVHGTVSNAETGAGVARALVVSNDRRLATMTDSAGHFSLEVRVPAPVVVSPGGVPPQGTATAGGGPTSVFGVVKTVVLMVEKPGFLPRPAQGQFVLLDSAAKDQEVQFRLVPTARVTGQVTVDAGDVPQGIRVFLLRRAIEDGRHRWRVESNQTTDGDGQFTFADLRPGTYTVMTAEWRGDTPLPSSLNEVTEEYPAEFYGDSAAITPAGVIQAQPGGTTEVEMHLHRAMYYPVSLPVAGAAAVDNLFVTVDAGSGVAGAFELGYNGQDHAIEGRLPNGSYTVLAIARVAGGGARGSARQQQEVFGAGAFQVADRPVKAAAMAMGPMPALRVEVRFEGAAEAGQSFANLSLRSETGLGGGYGGSTLPGRPDGFEIKNVPPGRYALTAEGSGYLAELSCDGVDLLSEPLVIGAGGLDRPIEMTVRQDGGSVAGQIAAGVGGSPRLLQVLLLPMDGTARFEQTNAEPDGHFSFGTVAPGTYRLLATDGNEVEIPYREPESMLSYRDVGATVQVAAGQAVEQDAPLVSEDQLEAREAAAAQRGVGP